MARAIKLINAPAGLFDIDGVLVLKTEYSTQHEDGAITPDCYIVDSGEYFWGGVDSVEERNNLMVTPIDMPTLTPPNEPLSVLVNDEPDREYIDYICPRCKDIISQRRRGQRMETVYQCKYHDNCGQRMDWSNPQPYRRPPEAKDNNVPTNEPLTLDELLKMDGEPVWVVPIGKCKWATRQWCVLAADEVLIPGVDHWWWSFEDYGETWIAYRRPPEGEEDT